MDSEYLPNSSREVDFGFAFNDSNFSDRVFHIEIIADSPEIWSHEEGGCSSLADWARHWKRKREYLNKEIAVDNAGCHEEEILHADQPDIHDEVKYEDEEEAVAMIEEWTSGI